MSCYHPLVGFDYGINPETGKKNIKVLPVTGDVGKTLELNPGSVLIPCGKCIGCRMDYSRRWADRMMFELESAGKAVFVTLTYDCRNVVDLEGEKVCTCIYPDIDVRNGEKCTHSLNCGYYCRQNGSLYKDHVRTFMKDLREELRSKRNQFIRFYACGEYGSWENTHRPHYHIILFGLGLDDLENLQPVGFNELRQEVYHSDLIARHWPYGFVSVGDVSWKSCAYVSRYVTKKALEPSNQDLLDMLGKNHMFSLMSRRPGIGKPYLDAHPDCLDYLSIYVSTKDGSKKINIPRYFVNQLESTNKEKYDSIIAQRALYAQNSMYSKLNQTDLELSDYLLVEENAMLEKVKSLKRSI